MESALLGFGAGDGGMNLFNRIGSLVPDSGVGIVESICEIGECRGGLFAKTEPEKMPRPSESAKPHCVLTSISTTEAPCRAP